MKTMLARVHLLATAVATCAAISSVCGQGTVIWDQQRLTDLSVWPGRYFMIPGSNPVGQQFTPSRSSLTAVSVVFGQNNNPSASAYLQAVIHEGPDIFGRVIGMSQPMNMGGTASGQGFMDFTFSTPVPLTPGAMYVFEIWHQTTDPYGLRYVTAPEDYLGGRAIAAGSPVNADLVFRVGTSVPEPRIVFLFAAGGLSILSALSARTSCATQRREAGP